MLFSFLIESPQATQNPRLVQMHADHFSADPFRSDQFVRLRTIKQEMECWIRYQNTEKCNISDARRSFFMWYPDNKKKHIKHDKECFIWYPNTIRSVSFDIQTREGVFYLISNTEKQYIKHEKECFIWYLTLRSNISNTRRSVLSDIQTCRSNVSNTRGSVSFDIQTPHQEYIKHERKCFIWYSNTEK